MIITTKKFKFNKNFIDILNYCSDKYIYFEKLHSYKYYSIFTILNIIKYISKYNKKKYYYYLPNELKNYFEKQNNLSNISFSIYVIKYFVNKEIFIDNIDNNFFNTYITISNISNNDNYGPKHFIVHI